MHCKLSCENVQLCFPPLQMFEINVGKEKHKKKRGKQKKT